MYELKAKLHSAMQILIYGAGVYGKTLVDFCLRNYDISQKIMAIVVTDIPVLKEIDGIPVKKIDDMIGYRERTTVVVAVAKDKQEAICNKLLSLGFSNYYCETEYQHMVMNRINNSILTSERQLIELSVKQTIEGTCRKDLHNGLKELIYAQNFSRAIDKSKWITNKDIKAGDAAVNHQYLYTMYRILDTGRFKNILDIGMGSTSKLISQYAIYAKNVLHYVVEADEAWEKFMKLYWSFSNATQMIHMDYKMVEYDGNLVRCYEGFKEKLSGKKFDFISIDAPLGIDMKKYSRRDILEILPDCLSESWIIMIDDVDRIAEQNTVSLISQCLEENRVAYVYHVHYTTKAFGIFTSEDNKFFGTV